MKKVKVYALSTCPWCMKTKQFFKDHKVDFECVEYDQADAKTQKTVMADMQKRGGGNSFPFVIIGDEAVEGYDPDQFCSMLGVKK